MDLRDPRAEEAVSEGRRSVHEGRRKALPCLEKGFPTRGDPARELHLRDALATRSRCAALALLSLGRGASGDRVLFDHDTPPRGVGE
jgi:hypothetical protein